jgi:predicted HTH domain antitoxin
MAIVIDIPADVERALRARGADVDAAAREAFLADCYRRGSLSLGELAALLRLETSLEALEWLQKRGAGLNYDASDLSNDIATLQKLGLKK